MRLGLFGSAAPRVRSALAPQSAITKRDMPSILPPAWLVEKARAQGVDPMLEWEAMQQGAGQTTAPAPASTPPLGMMGRGPQGRLAAPSIAPQTMPQPAPAMASTMGAAAQPQVKAGMQMAAQDMAARPQKLGAFGNGPAPAAAAKPVGLWDEIWADPFTFFLTGTDGLDRKYDRVKTEGETARTAQEKAQFDAMIRSLPQDQQLLWMTNPEEMAKAMASNYEAANVGAGDTRYLGGTDKTYTAPKMGFEGATPYAQTFGDGKLTTTFGDDRPMSYAEMTAEGTLAETGRHNRATEGLERDKFRFDQTKPTTPQFGDENSYRNQYLGQVKTFQDVARAASSVRSLSPTMNPAEQMALIFQTMKMLDPGSTVREGEYANAQNTTGALGQMWNAYNKAMTGQGLNPTQISDFRGMIDGLYNAAEGQYAQTYDFYRGMAPRYSMDPSIIQDFRLAPVAQPGPVGGGAMAAMQSALGQAPSAAELGDDELRALLGL